MAFDLDDEELNATKKLYLKNKVILDSTKKDTNFKEESR